MTSQRARVSLALVVLLLFVPIQQRGFCQGKTENAGAATVVAAGPLQMQREKISSMISEAAVKGVGVANFKTAFADIENKVQAGTPEKDLEQSVSRLSQALAEQLERTVAAKQHLAPPPSNKTATGAPPKLLATMAEVKLRQGELIKFTNQTKDRQTDPAVKIRMGQLHRAFESAVAKFRVEQQKQVEAVDKVYQAREQDPAKDPQREKLRSYQHDIARLRVQGRARLSSTPGMLRVSGPTGGLRMSELSAMSEVRQIREKASKDFAESIKQSQAKLKKEQEQKKQQANQQENE